MKLSSFIERDMEAILTDWERFAATLLPAAAHMDSDALRDHVVHILRAVCKDIDASQTEGSDPLPHRAPRERLRQGTGSSNPQFQMSQMYSSSLVKREL